MTSRIQVLLVAGAMVALFLAAPLLTGCSSTRMTPRQAERERIRKDRDAAHENMDKEVEKHRKRAHSD